MAKRTITTKIFVSLKYCLLFAVLITANFSKAQKVFKFEHFNSENGLSQNTVFSILVDSKGFLWAGTMNGLNRFDGRVFKVYKGRGGRSEMLTNNRISKIWEDKRGFIWTETYDGYYHFFNPKKEVFTTLPTYTGLEEERNSVGSCFFQYSPNRIIMGTTNSGIYFLDYDSVLNTYTQHRYLNRGQNAISNNRVHNVFADSEKNVWITTQMGLNFISPEEMTHHETEFQHLYVNVTFTQAITETKDFVWFGTKNKGMLEYNKRSKTYKLANLPVELVNNQLINNIQPFSNNQLLIGSNKNGLWLYDIATETAKRQEFHGTAVMNIYVDTFGDAWVTSKELGVTRVNPKSLQSTFYELTPPQYRFITDLERQFFFEDKNNQLWIGLHGSGLASYDRQNDKFVFYRNEPNKKNSISSNVVHCIAEDANAQLWLGVGQYNGGLEKVIFRDPAIQNYTLHLDSEFLHNNVVRATLQDKNGVLWIATKSGEIFFQKEQSAALENYTIRGSLANKWSNNVYCIFQDSQGYIWLGTKGEGLAVSKAPISPQTNYANIQYDWYRHIPGDSTSIVGNNIYSIAEHDGRIWIGTYDNGISILSHQKEKPHNIININDNNTNISNNQIRHILIDHNKNIWIASVFGINFLSNKNAIANNFKFKKILHTPNIDKSLPYNDVVHIFEDSHDQLWFATFGGGLSKLNSVKNDTYKFTTYSTKNGLSNDVAFGILEDPSGNIWCSTENGLNRINPQDGSIDIIGKNNGLLTTNFSENTCFTKQNGNLIFGGSMGFIEIDPQKFVVTSQLTTVELTTFFLFNKEIAVGENDTPLKQSIPFTTNITLNNNQSSFSIEYVALCQSDQAQVSYAFMLQNFEKDWNYVGNQTKATYTNLSPGKYTFRVKATLRSGRWDQPERILEITILPPWYKTWWAFTIWLVLIAAILWAIRNTLLKLNHYRRDLQVEKRVNQVKLQFFTNISHEIRTPLTLIIGPIEELISDKATAGATKPKLQIIHKNAKRMLLLTNQLLDFRKIQNNKMKIKVRQFDLVRFAKEIYENFGPMAQHKKIDYQFYSQKENLLIWADPSKIDIIIFNLLSNALKFTSAGKKVSLSLVFETKTHVAIQIKDQGKGIPEKLQPELFTRYTILSNNEQSGTGIGLSLSYELAKLHGGDILVNSTEGEGSLFTLKIPIEKEQYLVNSNAVVIEKDIEQVIHSTTGIYTEEDTEQADTPTENKTTQLTALVVEDTPEILEYICNSLQPEFYAIRATNGEEALKMAQTQPIDIIITDLMMPVMDGLELTRKLKSNFDTSHIPIVMLTARTTINDQIEGIGMGAEAYISKPFNTNYLKTVCINLIKQRQKLIDRFTSNKNIEPGQLKIQSKDEDFLQKLVEYIQQHYSDEIVIDHLAEHCCLSRTVFYNKLKGLTGLSPVEFLREMKLKIAIQLLEKGYNVSEVAFKVGFNDVKYFSRQFKAQFGYPPSKHTAPDSHHE